MISHLRREYTQAGLSEQDLQPGPQEQFRRWIQDAIDGELTEPNAAVLATVDEQGQPSTRVVLVKGVDERGFSFFTNYESRKGRELAANPRAALTFPWVEMERQVCITGRVTQLPREESDAYFRTRPRGSRLGAWASKQSEVIADRTILEQRLADLDREYPGNDIPMPPTWGGYVLAPDAVEFWQGRHSRLHDRLVYTRQAGSWKVHRLSP
ncbi:MAG TPA: pyridoxamine 5'-phosphate oxidase [Verrucomicrobiae bacterium]|nr:pyridoxamine 5'-phosphate oxidase [Verrucomicrobiae bacterium]